MVRDLLSLQSLCQQPQNLYLSSSLSEKYQPTTKRVTLSLVMPYLVHVQPISIASEAYSGDIRNNNQFSDRLLESAVFARLEPDTQKIVDVK